MPRFDIPTNSLYYLALVYGPIFPLQDPSDGSLGLSSRGPRFELASHALAEVGRFIAERLEAAVAPAADTGEGRPVLRAPKQGYWWLLMVDIDRAPLKGI